MAKKKNPDEYYLGEFINKLRDENAEITYNGKKYSSKKGYLSIISLAADVLDMNEHNIYAITRNTLKAESISRKGKVTYEQTNVLKQFDFRFSKSGLNTIEKVKSNKYCQLHHRSNDVKKSDIIKSKRRLFIFERGDLLHSYPEIPNTVTKSVIDFIKSNCIEDIYRKAFLSFYLDNGPFIELSKSLYAVDKNKDFKPGNKRPLKILYEPRNLGSFVREYQKRLEKIKQNGNLWPSSTLIPQYRFGKGTFEYDSVNDNHEFKSIYEIVKAENFFDRYRYKRIRVIEQDLKNDLVPYWPSWTIDNIIISQLEFVFLREELEKRVYDEIANNLIFTLYTSTDGNTIDMQSDYENLQELSTELSEYRFPAGIDEYLSIKNSNLLAGSFYKYPTKFHARNQDHPFDIKSDIETALITKFCETISKNIHMDQRVVHDMVRNVRKIIMQESINGSENINI